MAFFKSRPNFENRQMVQYMGDKIHLSGQTNFDLGNFNSYIYNSYEDFLNGVSGGSYNDVPLSAATDEFIGYSEQPVYEPGVVRIIPPTMVSFSGNTDIITGSTQEDVTGYFLTSLDSKGTVVWKSISGLTTNPNPSSGSCTPITYTNEITPCDSGDTVVVNGNLVVKGTTTSGVTTIETEIVRVEDNNMELNYGGNHSTSIGGGITVINGVSDTTPQVGSVHSNIKTQSNGGWEINPSVSVGELNDIKPYCFGVGVNNIISFGQNSLISGSGNTIQTGLNNSIIGGENNTLIGNNSVVLGGQGITGTSDNTTYVPILNIGTVGSTTSVNNLGIDSDGNVVVGSSGGSSLWYEGSGNGSVKLMDTNEATGDYSVAEGGMSDEGPLPTKSIGLSSHAEGAGTESEGITSHAEGFSTRAIGRASHAEGQNTTASGDYSHAEGTTNNVSGRASHVEGGFNQANGDYTHVEGRQNTADSDYSHVGGLGCTTTGSTSFIHSRNSFLYGDRSVVLGGEGIIGYQDDTVYVPILNIRDVLTGSSVSLLGVDSDGNVVSDNSPFVLVDGTPVDNQVGVWTSDRTIEGTSGMTYNGNSLEVEGQMSSSMSSVAAVTSATTIDWDGGNSCELYSNTSTTLTLDNPVVGSSYFIKILRIPGGSSEGPGPSVEFPSNCYFPNETPPFTLGVTDESGAIDSVVLFYDGSTYICGYNQNHGNITPPS